MPFEPTVNTAKAIARRKFTEILWRSKPTNPDNLWGERALWDAVAGPKIIGFQFEGVPPGWLIEVWLDNIQIISQQGSPASAFFTPAYPGTVVRLEAEYQSGTDSLGDVFMTILYDHTIYAQRVNVLQIDNIEVTVIRGRMFQILEPSIPWTTPQYLAFVGDPAGSF